MTSQPTPPLADLERDALAELSIAMARAANSLRQWSSIKSCFPSPASTSFPRMKPRDLSASPTQLRCHRFKSSTISTTPPSAGIAGVPVFAENSATDSPKSANACENLVAQVTPISSNGGALAVNPNHAEYETRREHAN